MWTAVGKGLTLTHAQGEKQTKKYLFFMANKLCDKSLQIPERCMPCSRQLSSGEQQGPAEQEMHAVTDVDHGRAGS